jgi:hypothetical protein
MKALLAWVKKSVFESEDRMGYTNFRSQVQCPSAYQTLIAELSSLMEQPIVQHVVL